MTYPTVDPNPPATPPDTTVNGGSDYSGTSGRPYVSPDSIVTSQNVSNKETTSPGAAGTDANLTGPDSSRTVNAPQTSGTDGTTATGAVVSTAYASGTPSTTQSGGAPGSTSTAAYREPAGDVPADNRDTTLTGARRTDVPDDNNPNALPSGYTVNLRDTTGVGGGTGPGTYTPPGAPTGVTATAVAGKREVRVSWTPGAAPVGRVLKRWIVQGSTTGTKIVPADETQTVLSDGLAGGDKYRFTVYGETDLGTGYRSAPSNEVTVATGTQIADVDYVEDDREGHYSSAGVRTPATPET